jgi:ABC-type multidrug transport system fused ATPase/permease subunit
LYLQNFFRKKTFEKIDENTKNALAIRGLIGWFETNYALFFGTFLLIPAYSLLVYQLYTGYDNGQVDLILITFYFRRTMSFNWNFKAILNSLSDFEIVSIAAERCQNFESIKPESGYKTVESDKANFQNLKKNLKTALVSLKKTMDEEEKNVGKFKEGKIEFEKVSASYPTSTKPVIRGINLLIKPGQKIGIVGRTGAGKSSFIKLLWRSLTPSKGTIKIDGVDINTVDLKFFRSQISVILQKPNLFKGTIASNITTEKLSKEQLKNIREKLINLGFPLQKLMDDELAYEVEASGVNLSQSEKQMICLIQALMKKSKIAILDEATAYVDVQMEKKFNELIWGHFEESTLFVIAHRVVNVMKCDRILVFEEGKIVQDGSPQELIQQVGGIFHQIWSQR